MIQVKNEYCPQNHHCPVLRLCPVDAISQENPFSAPVVDEKKCTDCGRCTHACNVFQA